MSTFDFKKLNAELTEAGLTTKKSRSNNKKEQVFHLDNLKDYGEQVYGIKWENLNGTETKRKVSKLRGMFRDKLFSNVKTLLSISDKKTFEKTYAPFKKEYEIIYAISYSDLAERDQTSDNLSRVLKQFVLKLSKLGLN